MRDLAELNVLLRVNTEMPEGLRPATDEFREGWNRIRNGNAIGLEKRIKAHKWHLVSNARSIAASGTGVTPQQAVSRALDHALGKVDSRLNALEVSDIQSTHYPWFWLARIRVRTYRIQQDDAPAMADELYTVPGVEAGQISGTDSSDVNQEFANAGPRTDQRQKTRSSEVNGAAGLQSGSN